MTASSLRVGLLQTNPRVGAAEANAAELFVRGAELARRGAELVVSAELSVSGYRVGAVGEPVRPDALAAAWSAGAVLGAGIVRQERAGTFNSYCWLSAGEVLGRQDKTHLVRAEPWREDSGYAAGEAIEIVTLPGGARVGAVICNDMWHPIVPWSAVHRGAEVLVAPVASAEGLHPGVRDTWALICRHTAALLQCYVLMVNQAGAADGLTFWGGSAAYGPDGRELVRLGAAPDSTIVELDLAALRERRRAYPLLQERNDAFVRRLVHDAPTAPQVRPAAGLRLDE